MLNIGADNRSTPSFVLVHLLGHLLPFVYVSVSAFDRMQLSKNNNLQHTTHPNTHTPQHSETHSKITKSSAYILK